MNFLTVIPQKNIFFVDQIIKYLNRIILFILILYYVMQHTSFNLNTNYSWDPGKICLN